MKNTRMLLLLAATMVGTINATKNPNVVQIEPFLTGKFFNDKQQSWAHMLALHCNNPEFTIRSKPELFLKTIIAEQRERHSDAPKKKAFDWYLEFLGQKNPDDFFLPDADGMTPLDILEKQECQTELCHLLKTFIDDMKQDAEELNRDIIVNVVQVQK